MKTIKVISVGLFDVEKKLNKRIIPRCIPTFSSSCLPKSYMIR